LAGASVGSDETTQVGEQLDLGGALSMSFSAWVKSSRATEYGTLLHGYGVPVYAGYAVQIWPNTGRPRYHPGWSDNSYYNNLPGPPNVMDGDWHHLVVTANGTEVRFYVDGKTKANWKHIQTAVSQGSFTGDRFIGHHANTEYDSQLAGFLDDMGIWKNKALSVPEIALLHGLGRVQGSDLSWLDEIAALWAGAAGERATIDGVLWEKVAGLQGALGDWDGSTQTRDGLIVLDASGGGIRMVAP